MAKVACKLEDLLFMSLFDDEEGKKKKKKKKRKKKKVDESEVKSCHENLLTPKPDNLELEMDNFS